MSTGVVLEYQVIDGLNVVMSIHATITEKAKKADVHNVPLCTGGSRQLFRHSSSTSSPLKAAVGS